MKFDSPAIQAVSGRPAPGKPDSLEFKFTATGIDTLQALHDHHRGRKEHATRPHSRSRSTPTNRQPSL